MKQPGISVIVPIRNGGRVWRETLRALLGQSTALPFELIVIDSESSDGTAEVAERMCSDPLTNPQNIQLCLIRIRVREFRHGGTRNLGASHARGEFLIFLSQDATPIGTNWLRELVRPFENSKVVGAFGRQIPRPKAPITEQYGIHKAFPDRPRIFTAADFGSTNMLFCDVSSAMRRTVWQKYPLPDVLMGEDGQWAVLVLQAGYCIAYVAAAQVCHSHHYTLWQQLKRNFDTGVALSGMAAYSRNRSSRYLQSLTEEISFVLRRGGLRRLPEAVISEGIGVLGFALGTNHARLPTWLCHRLTWFPQWFPR